MQKINLLAACILLALLPITYNTQAQDIHGTASITVKKGNEAPVNYKFPDFPNTVYNCNQTGTEGSKISHTDIGFSRPFSQFKNADGSPPIVSVQMRISPSGKGTFILNPKPDSDGPTGDLEIDLNAPAEPLNDFTDGTGGTITITNYPGIGGYLEGSFKANLKDANGNAYQVSGEFRIKRQNDTQ